MNLLMQSVFLGPTLLFFIVIVVIPFFLGMYYSFTDWNGVAVTVNWVGVRNFAAMFGDSKFWASFGFTVRFTLAVVILTNVIGLMLALLLVNPLKMRNLLRTLFFIPNVIGGLLLGFIWQFIFIRGFAAVGKATGIGFFNLEWLGTEATGFWGIVIVFVWQAAGYMMIIYIAGLINVDRSLLEAADIDGAGYGQKLRFITFPLIMPAVTVCLFLSMSHAFKMFDLNLSLTHGGPFGSTESLALNIYTEAFTNSNYGLGTAKALLFFVIVAAVSSLQVWFTKRMEVQS
ncbi:sugar ABC transporter permease [Saccharibacillus sp. CPCC 101409]|uniref:carbohydrate ABC transporter permease n=1 Tax=Saccharibacillus sp. CPCC 101409 TaxID=3058041 RepID=UPI00267195CD|nr:sugar ABC transporter permease [Saccharibacillus sp. CPCC 101409]MDO3412702.1 sugar ABC transporter permease [Saccharibacillus sp. CPCC 101409]